MNRISLDEFLEKNTVPVRVHESSAPVTIGNITFAPGLQIDLMALCGQGYFLEEQNLPDAIEEITYAYLLNTDESRTGYHLISTGPPPEYVLEDDGISERFQRHIAKRGGLELFGKFYWRKR
ncbi:hypothetical protein HYX14_02570 [Candidatus Woesearchaeota archaeon]|nr:hypothetical protein [Candidatus Woesearchaeota archaeon]